MADSFPPEDFADWNEQMVQRRDQEAFSRHSRSAVRWVENLRFKAVIRALNLRPESVVLDVGCGGGMLLEQMSGSELYGVDLSPFMVQRARERLNRDVKILQADAEHLPFPNNFFDRVSATSLLSHVLHPEIVVSEIRRVTKPGGRVVISVSDEDQIERGMRWVKAIKLERLFLGTSRQGDPAAIYNVDYHLQRFSLNRLREVTGEKLEEIDVTRVPAFYPVHWVAAYDR